MDLNDTLQNLLKESIRDSFVTTTQLTPVQVETPELTDENCIISSIGFTGTIEGSFAICLTNSSACIVLSKMLGTEFSEVNNDIIDGISEQINMIAGGVKMKLAQVSDHTFEIGIPTTIKGSRMVILSDFTKTKQLSLNYEFEGIACSVSMIYKLYADKTDEEKEKQQARLDAFAKLSSLNTKN